MKHPTRLQRTLLLTVLTLAMFMSWQGASLAQPANTWMANKLITSVISGGGISSPTATQGYLLQGTLGQPTPIGLLGIPGQYVLHAGFWHKYGRYYIVGLDDKVPAPQITELCQNRPNPFTGSTMILFSLHEPSSVELSIFDVSGRRVRTLLDEHKEAGWHQLNWDGKDAAGWNVAVGVYFYRLTTNTYQSTKQMLLWK